jgi:UDP-N-acetyl-D-glucosamine dehydrogenase
MRGESYIAHIPADWIKQWLAESRFRATDDSQLLSEPDAILICVPTPLTATRDPDLTYVVDTAKKIANALRPGQLIVLESTTYPGTTRDVVLRELAKSGLQIGEEYFLAYSPEREDPANESFTAATIPKVVGAVDEPSSRASQALYRAVVNQVVPVSSCEVAEASKILENTYRAVNIALVNELKILCQRMGIDIWEAIDAAKSKPFGFQAFYPGPGLGGHCIPIDPFYLSWIARKYGMSTRFIELAGEVNSSMPDYVVRRVGDALNDCGKAVRGSSISILGMAYKPNVDDTRESPSFELMEHLIDQGARVTYNDPHVPQLPKKRSYDLPGMTSSPLTSDYLASQDLVLIATDHRAYDFDFIVEHSRLIVDTRNATKNVVKGREKIVRA